MSVVLTDMLLHVKERLQTDPELQHGISIDRSEVAQPEGQRSAWQGACCIVGVASLCHAMSTKKM
jgi:hypothetical protein